MTKTIIFFRGRNTEGIFADAKRLGVFGSADTPLVICRDEDALAAPGDIPANTENIADLIAELGANGRPAGVVIVANGGTTEQLVPVLLAFTAVPDLKVVTVGRDTVTEFARRG